MPENRVTVYSTGPQCQKCKATKRAFEKLGIEVTEWRADRDPDLLDKFTKMGHTTAPVVRVNYEDGAEYWSDLRLDRIKAAAVRLRGGAAA